MVGEDIVESVRNHQQRKDVIEFITLFGSGFKGLSQDAKDVNGWFSVTLLEIFKFCLCDISVKIVVELAVDFSNFFQEIFAVVVKLREFHLILVQIFINFLHQLFELLCFFVLTPSHVGI